MSKMLSFFESTWASARHQAVVGRRAESLKTLTPLLTSPLAPDRLALLAHRLAARLHFAAGRYRQTRKHLYTAAKLDPKLAEVHYEIGQAFESDPAGSDRRAARRYKLAVKLAPRQGRFVAALGRSLVRLDRVKAGLARLREAAKLAPKDVAVLRVVAEGLHEAERTAEACALLNQARFLLPSSRELEQLCGEWKFRQASTVTPKRRAVAGGVLSFSAAAVGEGPAVRRDFARRPAPHFARLRTYTSEQG